MTLFKHQATHVFRRAEVLLIRQPRTLGDTAEVYFYLPQQREKINQATPPKGKMTSFPNSKVREASGRVQHKAFLKHMEIFPHLPTFNNFI